MVQVTQTDLANILDGKKQYQVPLYQRVYSWQTKQLDQLWNDLTELVELRADDSTATHFMGSLVLANSPANAIGAVQQMLVVDGQQRLTTLSLLLCALRDYLVQRAEPEQAQGIDAQYLVNVYDRGRPQKLLPTQKDRDAYTAVLKRTPQAGGDDLIGAAYRYFVGKIASYAEAEQTTGTEQPSDTAAAPPAPAVSDAAPDSRLEELEHSVLRGLVLVVVTAEAGDNAHRIFESLNNTGLRLTQGDLLKNYLFMRLGDRADIVYEHNWLPIEHLLDADEIEQLFWLDLAQTDEKARQSEIYAGQQRRLDKLTPAQIEDEIARFQRLAQALDRVLHPERETDPTVRERLQRLRTWGTTTAQPLVLHILARRDDKQISNDDTVRALAVLESFFVRRIVIGKATTGLNRTLLQAVGAIAGAGDVPTALREFFSRGRRYFATDAQVRDAVHHVAFYWQGPRRAEETHPRLARSSLTRQRSRRHRRAHHRTRAAADAQRPGTTRIRGHPA
jgi:hypothetical protein